MKCSCCSEKHYNECCEPYHNGQSNAATAESLMRSRYAAFAIPNGKYLWETTSPLMRKFHLEKEYQASAELNQWTKLEIIHLPTFDQVEFKAYFTDEKGIQQIHHELSKFERMEGKWYYVSGDFFD